MAKFTQVQDNVEQQENAVAVPIFQPSGEPYLAPEVDEKGDAKQCTITVLGAESKKYRQMENTITRRNLRNKKPVLDPADLRRNRIDQAGAVVTEWFGWEDLPFTPENVQAMLATDHILKQVEAGIHGHADFFARSSQASSK